MIVEMRTYLLRPGSVPEVENRLGNNLPHRVHMSPLAGLFHTLSGPLNTVVHLWPYDSIQKRCDIRAAMMRPPLWPPPLREFLLEMDSIILIPAPFSPDLAPARHGELYEFCIDTCLPGGPAANCESWAPALAERTRLSQLVFAGTSEFGRLNQWIHVWAYRNAAHREGVHAELAQEDRWPPRSGREFLLRQDSFLAAPAWCSPLH